MMSFSVLMSVYDGEEPEYLKQALESISCQSLMPSEIVLVEDGPLKSTLVDVISNFRPRLPIVSLMLPQNVGLAAALNEGLSLCLEKIIFRADSDDINMPDRFKVQMAFLNDNPDIDVLGGQVDSFDSFSENIILGRRVPLAQTDIIKFARFFSPMNHPSVAFRKNAVESVGGYPNIRTNQDQALWALLLNNGFKFNNLDLVLVSMRVDSKFMERRLKNRFKNELQMLRFQRKIGFIDRKTFFLMSILRWSSRLLPKIAFNFLYKIVRSSLNFLNTSRLKIES